MIAVKSRYEGSRECKNSKYISVREKKWVELLHMI